MTGRCLTTLSYIKYGLFQSLRDLRFIWRYQSINFKLMKYQKIKNLMFFAILSGLLHISADKAPENTYESVLTFNDQEIRLSGKATFSNAPGMRSFYFEESESVRCSIHVLRLRDDDILKTGTYPVGTDDEPRAGAVCGVHLNEDSRERVSSRSGEFVIDEIAGHHVSGTFDIRLKGDRTGTEYHLSGTFVAQSSI